MSDSFLNVVNLKTHFDTPEGVAKAVDGVSFSVARGETLAIVGESGCGKTVTAFSLIRLLPKNARMQADSIYLEGRDITNLNREEARNIRGKQISMVFQEPMTSLNPTYKIGRQIKEVFRVHYPQMRAKEIKERMIGILQRVGVPDPEQRLDAYPHQLSGGLRQRVMIAICLAANPPLVIADEPTTALDVTIQAQILDLLRDLQAENNMSIMLITHDFGVVSQIAHRVAVMYAGKIVEEGTTSEIFANPLHPYTQLLILSIPGIKVKRGGQLEVISGSVPNPMKFPDGCRFHTRCPYVMDVCRTDEPPEMQMKNRRVSCFRAGEEVR